MQTSFHLRIMQLLNYQNGLAIQDCIEFQTSKGRSRVLIANYHRFLWERVYDVASKYCIFCFRTSVVKEVRGANESVLWPSRWQGYVYRIDAKNPYSIHREGGKKLGQWLAETNLWDWCKSIFLALGEWRGDTKLTFTLSLWLSCRINSKTRKVYKNG